MAAGYVSRAVAAVGGAVKCWKDELNISVYWVSRSINWATLREKPENMFLLEERWLSTALGPGVKGQASVEVESPGFFCSRKSHYLLEITLLSSKTNSTCNEFRTKMQPWCSCWSHEAPSLFPVISELIHITSQQGLH